MQARSCKSLARISFGDLYPKFTHYTVDNFIFFPGVKEFSNWPTIPQIYLEGEFVGGCDILLQMHQSGELVEELSKVGIKSALLAKEEEEGEDKSKT